MTAGTPHPDPSPGRSALRLLRHEFVTPEAIYGTVLITVIIAVQEEENPAGVGLLVPALTAFVFWLAHVFAHTVARHGVKRGKEVPLATAVREAIFHSTGFLTGPLIPLLLLGLAPLGILDEESAYTAAEVSSLVILFVLGALALAERGRRWYACLVGGLLTSGVGLLVIALELILH